MMILKMRTVMDTYTTTRKLRFFFKAGLAKQSFYALETRIYTTKVL